MRIREASVSLLVAALAVGTMPKGAVAISAELAKKCQAMMVKKYPPKLAGSYQGNSRVEREFFGSCVARNGNMDPQPQPEPVPVTAPR